MAEDKSGGMQQENWLIKLGLEVDSGNTNDFISKVTTLENKFNESGDRNILSQINNRLKTAEKILSESAKIKDKFSDINFTEMREILGGMKDTIKSFNEMNGQLKKQKPTVLKDMAESVKISMSQSNLKPDIAAIHNAVSNLDTRAQINALISQQATMMDAINKLSEQVSLNMKASENIVAIGNGLKNVESSVSSISNAFSKMSSVHPASSVQQGVQVIHGDPNKMYPKYDNMSKEINELDKTYKKKITELNQMVNGISIERPQKKKSEKKDSTAPVTESNPATSATKSVVNTAQAPPVSSSMMMNSHPSGNYSRRYAPFINDFTQETSRATGRNIRVVYGGRLSNDEVGRVEHSGQNSNIYIRRGLSPEGRLLVATHENVHTRAAYQRTPLEELSQKEKRPAITNINELTTQIASLMEIKKSGLKLNRDSISNINNILSSSLESNGIGSRAASKLASSIVSNTVRNSGDFGKVLSDINMALTSSEENLSRHQKAFRTNVLKFIESQGIKSAKDIQHYANIMETSIRQMFSYSSPMSFGSFSNNGRMINRDFSKGASSVPSSNRVLEKNIFKSPEEIFKHLLGKRFKWEEKYEGENVYEHINRNLANLPVNTRKFDETSGKFNHSASALSEIKVNSQGAFYSAVRDALQGLDVSASNPVVTRGKYGAPEYYKQLRQIIRQAKMGNFDFSQIGSISSRGGFEEGVNYNDTGESSGARKSEESPFAIESGMDKELKDVYEKILDKRRLSAKDKLVLKDYGINPADVDKWMKGTYNLEEKSSNKSNRVKIGFYDLHASSQDRLEEFYNDINSMSGENTSQKNIEDMKKSYRANVMKYFRDNDIKNRNGVRLDSRQQKRIAEESWRTFSEENDINKKVTSPSFSTLMEMLNTENGPISLITHDFNAFSKNPSLSGLGYEKLRNVGREAMSARLGGTKRTSENIERTISAMGLGSNSSLGIKEGYNLVESFTDIINSNTGSNKDNINSIWRGVITGLIGNDITGGGLFKGLSGRKTEKVKVLKSLIQSLYHDKIDSKMMKEMVNDSNIDMLISKLTTMSNANLQRASVYGTLSSRNTDNSLFRDMFGSASMTVKRGKKSASLHGYGLTLSDFAGLNDLLDTIENEQSGSQKEVNKEGKVVVSKKSLSGELPEVYKSLKEYDDIKKKLADPANSAKSKQEKLKKELSEADAKIHPLVKKLVRGIHKQYEGASPTMLSAARIMFSDPAVLEKLREVSTYADAKSKTEYNPFANFVEQRKDLLSQLKDITDEKERNAILGDVRALEDENLINNPFYSETIHTRKDAVEKLTNKQLREDAKKKYTSGGTELNPGKRILAQGILQQAREDYKIANHEINKFINEAVGFSYSQTVGWQDEEGEEHTKTKIIPGELLQGLGSTLNAAVNKSINKNKNLKNIKVAEGPQEGKNWGGLFEKESVIPQERIDIGQERLAEHHKKQDASSISRKSAIVNSPEFITMIRNIEASMAKIDQSVSGEGIFRTVDGDSKKYSNEVIGITSGATGSMYANYMDSSSTGMAMSKLVETFNNHFIANKNKFEAVGRNAAFPIPSTASVLFNPENISAIHSNSMSYFNNDIGSVKSQKQMSERTINNLIAKHIISKYASLTDDEGNKLHYPEELESGRKGILKALKNNEDYSPEHIKELLPADSAEEIVKIDELFNSEEYKNNVKSHEEIKRAYNESKIKSGAEELTGRLFGKGKALELAQKEIMKKGGKVSYNGNTYNIKDKQYVKSGSEISLIGSFLRNKISPNFKTGQEEIGNVGSILTDEIMKTKDFGDLNSFNINEQLVKDFDEYNRNISKDGTVLNKEVEERTVYASNAIKTAYRLVKDIEYRGGKITKEEAKAINEALSVMSASTKDTDNVIKGILQQAKKHDPEYQAIEKEIEEKEKDVTKLPEHSQVRADAVKALEKVKNKKYSLDNIYENVMPDFMKSGMKVSPRLLGRNYSAVQIHHDVDSIADDIIANTPKGIPEREMNAFKRYVELSKKMILLSSGGKVDNPQDVIRELSDVISGKDNIMAGVNGEIFSAFGANYGLDEKNKYKTVEDFLKKKSIKSEKYVAPFNQENFTVTGKPEKNFNINFAEYLTQSKKHLLDNVFGNNQEQLDKFIGSISNSNMSIFDYSGLEKDISEYGEGKIKNIPALAGLNKEHLNRISANKDSVSALMTVLRFTNGDNSKKFNINTVSASNDFDNFIKQSDISYKNYEEMWEEYQKNNRVKSVQNSAEEIAASANPETAENLKSNIEVPPVTDVKNKRTRKKAVKQAEQQVSQVTDTEVPQSEKIVKTEIKDAKQQAVDKVENANINNHSVSGIVIDFRIIEDRLGEISRATSLISDSIKVGFDTMKSILSLVETVIKSKSSSNSRKKSGSIDQIKTPSENAGIENKEESASDRTSNIAAARAVSEARENKDKAEREALKKEREALKKERELIESEKAKLASLASSGTPSITTDGGTEKVGSKPEINIKDNDIVQKIETVQKALVEEINKRVKIYEKYFQKIGTEAAFKNNAEAIEEISLIRGGKTSIVGDVGYKVAKIVKATSPEEQNTVKEILKPISRESQPVSAMYVSKDRLEKIKSESEEDYAKRLLTYSLTIATKEESRREKMLNSIISGINKNESKKVKIISGEEIGVYKKLKNGKSYEESTEDRIKISSAEASIRNLRNAPGTRNASNIASVARKELLEYFKEVGKESLPASVLMTSNQADKISKEYDNSMQRKYRQEQSQGKLVNSVINRVVLYGGLSYAFYGMTNKIGEAIKVMTDYEKSITDVKRVMDPMIVSIDRISEGAKRMAVAYGTNIRETADAMGVFAQQGKNASDVVTLTNASMLAANVAGYSATEATEALTAATRQFGIEDLKALAIIDSWSEVEARTAVTSKNLSDAVRQAGTSARVSGMSFHEFNGIISSVGSATRDTGNSLGNAFKYILSHLRVEESITALQNLGIAVYNVDGGFRDSFTILQDLAAQWNTLSTVQKENAAVTIAGARRYNTMLVLMDQWQEVLSAASMSEDSTGSAMQKNMLIMETYAKKVESMKASVESFYAKVGDSGGKSILTYFSNTLTNIFGVLNKMPDGMAALAATGATIFGIGTAVSRTISYSGADSWINNKTEAAKQESKINKELDAYLNKGYDGSLRKFYNAPLYQHRDERLSKMQLTDNEKIISNVMNSYYGPNKLANMSTEERITIQSRLADYLSNQKDIISDTTKIQKEVKQIWEKTREYTKENMVAIMAAGAGLKILAQTFSDKESITGRTVTGDVLNTFGSMALSAPGAMIAGEKVGKLVGGGTKGKLASGGVMAAIAALTMSSDIIDLGRNAYEEFFGSDRKTTSMIEKETSKIKSIQSAISTYQKLNDKKNTGEILTPLEIGNLKSAKDVLIRSNPEAVIFKGGGVELNDEFIANLSKEGDERDKRREELRIQLAYKKAFMSDSGIMGSPAIDRIRGNLESQRKEAVDLGSVRKSILEKINNSKSEQDKIFYQSKLYNVDYALDTLYGKMEENKTQGESVYEPFIDLFKSTGRQMSSDSRERGSRVFNRDVTDERFSRTRDSYIQTFGKDKFIEEGFMAIRDTAQSGRTLNPHKDALPLAKETNKMFMLLNDGYQKVGDNVKKFKVVVQDLYTNQQKTINFETPRGMNKESVIKRAKEELQKQFGDVYDYKKDFILSSSEISDEMFDLPMTAVKQFATTAKASFQEIINDYTRLEREVFKPVDFQKMSILTPKDSNKELEDRFLSIKKFSSNYERLIGTSKFDLEGFKTLSGEEQNRDFFAEINSRLAKISQNSNAGIMGLIDSSIHMDKMKSGLDLKVIKMVNSIVGAESRKKLSAAELSSMGEDTPDNQTAVELMRKEMDDLLKGTGESVSQLTSKFKDPEILRKEMTAFALIGKERFSKSSGLSDAEKENEKKIIDLVSKTAAAQQSAKETLVLYKEQRRNEILRKTGRYTIEDANRVDAEINIKQQELTAGMITPLERARKENKVKYSELIGIEQGNIDEIDKKLLNKNLSTTEKKSYNDERDVYVKQIENYKKNSESFDSLLSLIEGNTYKITPTTEKFAKQMMDAKSKAANMASKYTLFGGITGAEENNAIAIKSKRDYYSAIRDEEQKKLDMLNAKGKDNITKEDNDSIQRANQIIKALEIIISPLDKNLFDINNKVGNIRDQGAQNQRRLQTEFFVNKMMGSERTLGSQTELSKYGLGAGFELSKRITEALNDKDFSGKGGITDEFFKLMKNFGDVEKEIGKNSDPGYIKNMLLASPQEQAIASFIESQKEAGVSLQEIFSDTGLKEYAKDHALIGSLMDKMVRQEESSKLLESQDKLSNILLHLADIGERLIKAGIGGKEDAFGIKNGVVTAKSAGTSLPPTYTGNRAKQTNKGSISSKDEITPIPAIPINESVTALNSAEIATVSKTALSSGSLGLVSVSSLNSMLAAAQDKKYNAHLDKIKATRPELDANASLRFIQSLATEKEQKLAFSWTTKGKDFNPMLSEHRDAVKDAINKALEIKINPFESYSHLDFLKKYNDLKKLKNVKLNPQTHPEMKDMKNLGFGYTRYAVEGDNAQRTVRDFVDSHFGKNANPWCTTQVDENGTLTEESEEQWKKYLKNGKMSIIFKDNKLYALQGGREQYYWDKQDNPLENIGNKEFGIPGRDGVFSQVNIDRNGKINIGETYSKNIIPGYNTYVGDGYYSEDDYHIRKVTSKNGFDNFNKDGTLYSGYNNDGEHLNDGKYAYEIKKEYLADGSEKYKVNSKGKLEDTEYSEYIRDKHGNIKVVEYTGQKKPYSFIDGELRERLFKTPILLNVFRNGKLKNFSMHDISNKQYNTKYLSFELDEKGVLKYVNDYKYQKDNLFKSDYISFYQDGYQEKIQKIRNSIAEKIKYFRNNKQNQQYGRKSGDIGYKDFFNTHDAFNPILLNKVTRFLKDPTTELIRDTKTGEKYLTDRVYEIHNLIKNEDEILKLIRSKREISYREVRELGMSYSELGKIIIDNDNNTTLKNKGLELPASHILNPVTSLNNLKSNIWNLISFNNPKDKTYKGSIGSIESLHESIFGEKVNAKIVKDHPMIKKAGANTAGIFDPDSKNIFINEEYSKYKGISTVVGHETVHKITEKISSIFPELMPQINNDYKNYQKEKNSDWKKGVISLAGDKNTYNRNVNELTTAIISHALDIKGNKNIGGINGGYYFNGFSTDHKSDYVDLYEDFNKQLKSNGKWSENISSVIKMLEGKDRGGVNFKPGSISDMLNDDSMFNFAKSGKGLSNYLPDVIKNLKGFNEVVKRLENGASIEDISNMKSRVYDMIKNAKSYDAKKDPKQIEISKKLNNVRDFYNLNSGLYTSIPESANHRTQFMSIIEADSNLYNNKINSAVERAEKQKIDSRFSSKHDVKQMFFDELKEMIKGNKDSRGIRSGDFADYYLSNIAGSKEISGDIGLRYDAHGISKGSVNEQIKSLLNILENGVGKNLYTAPLNIPDEMRAGLGAALGTSGGTVYKDGSAILLSKPGNTILKGGINRVLINDVLKQLIPKLEKAYPEYKFSLMSEQKNILEQEYNDYFKNNKIIKDKEKIKLLPEHAESRQRIDNAIRKQKDAMSLVTEGVGPRRVFTTEISLQNALLSRNEKYSREVELGNDKKRQLFEKLNYQETEKTLAEKLRIKEREMSSSKDTLVPPVRNMMPGVEEVKPSNYSIKNFGANWNSAINAFMMYKSGKEAFEGFSNGQYGPAIADTAIASMFAADAMRNPNTLTPSKLGGGAILAYTGARAFSNLTDVHYPSKTEALGQTFIETAPWLALNPQTRKWGTDLAKFVGKETGLTKYASPYLSKASNFIPEGMKGIFKNIGMGAKGLSIPGMVLGLSSPYMESAIKSATGSDIAGEYAGGLSNMAMNATMPIIPAITAATEIGKFAINPNKYLDEKESGLAEKQINKMSPFLGRGVISSLNNSFMRGMLNLDDIMTGGKMIRPSIERDYKIDSSLEGQTKGLQILSSGDIKDLKHNAGEADDRSDEVDMSAIATLEKLLKSTGIKIGMSNDTKMAILNESRANKQGGETTFARSMTFRRIMEAISKQRGMYHGENESAGQRIKDDINWMKGYKDQNGQEYLTGVMNSINRVSESRNAYLLQEKIDSLSSNPDVKKKYDEFISEKLNSKKSVKQKAYDLNKKDYEDYIKSFSDVKVIESDYSNPDRLSGLVGAKRRKDIQEKFDKMQKSKEELNSLTKESVTNEYNKPQQIEQLELIKSRIEQEKNNKKEEGVNNAKESRIVAVSSVNRVKDNVNNKTSEKRNGIYVNGDEITYETDIFGNKTPTVQDKKWDEKAYDKKIDKVKSYTSKDEKRDIAKDKKDDYVRKEIDKLYSIEEESIKEFNPVPERDGLDMYDEIINSLSENYNENQKKSNNEVFFLPDAFGNPNIFTDSDSIEASNRWAEKHLKDIDKMNGDFVNQQQIDSRMGAGLESKMLNNYDSKLAPNYKQRAVDKIMNGGDSSEAEEMFKDMTDKINPISGFISSQDISKIPELSMSEKQARKLEEYNKLASSSNLAEVLPESGYHPKNNLFDGIYRDRLMNVIHGQDPIKDIMDIANPIRNKTRLQEKAELQEADYQAKLESGEIEGLPWEHKFTKAPDMLNVFEEDRLNRLSIKGKSQEFDEGTLRNEADIFMGSKNSAKSENISGNISVDASGLQGALTETFGGPLAKLLAEMLIPQIKNIIKEGVGNSTMAGVKVNDAKFMVYK